MISGRGNPNDKDFSERVGVLYSLAWAVKMRYKADCNHSFKGKVAGAEVDDYTIYPLEGIWKSEGDGPLNKENLVYTIMIRQPDFVTKELADIAIDTVQKKKPHLFLSEAVFGTMSDRICAQILHIGSYDDEPASFDKMNQFISDNGFERVDDIHREIYLNNAQRVLMKSKLQTILRYRIKKS